MHACLILIEEVKGERGGVGAEKQDSKGARFESLFRQGFD